MQTLRYAPADIASHYPLPVTGPVAWRKAETGWTATVALPPLPNEHIVVPSLAQYDGTTERVRFELIDADRVWSIAPNDSGPATAACPAADVTTHIDYFHTRAALSAPTLRINVAAPAAPRRYLIAVSGRNFAMQTTPGCDVAARLIVPAISQLTAPRHIRHRICSPVSLAMLLAYHGHAASLADVSAACYHDPSRLYGVWPLAIDRAARAGMVAAAECFESLDTAAAIIARGLPVIASIRFATDALPGAALRATDGHLLVVTGMDSDLVYVNDPAAKDASQVPRSYPRAAFAAAWLGQRGVGYVLAPLG